MSDYEVPKKCPYCFDDLCDLWDGEPVSAFVGEWSDDRFRCEGKPSCGYFGFEDFGIEYEE